MLSIFSMLCLPKLFFQSAFESDRLPYMNIFWLHLYCGYTLHKSFIVIPFFLIWMNKPYFLSFITVIGSNMMDFNYGKLKILKGEEVRKKGK